MSAPLPDVTIRHAREALAKAETSNVGQMTQLDMAERLGELTANLRQLLTLVDESEAGGQR